MQVESTSSWTEDLLRIGRTLETIVDTIPSRISKRIETEVVDSVLDRVSELLGESLDELKDVLSKVPDDHQVLEKLSSTVEDLEKLIQNIDDLKGLNFFYQKDGDDQDLAEQCYIELRKCSMDPRKLYKEIKNSQEEKLEEKEEEEEEKEEEENTKPNSMLENWKTQLTRLQEFDSWQKGKYFEIPETGKTVKFDKLPSHQQKRIKDNYIKGNEQSVPVKKKVPRKHRAKDKIRKARILPEDTRIGIEQVGVVFFEAYFPTRVQDTMINAGYKIRSKEGYVIVPNMWVIGIHKDADLSEEEFGDQIRRIKARKRGSLKEFLEDKLVLGSLFSFKEHVYTLVFPYTQDIDQIEFTTYGFLP